MTDDSLAGIRVVDLATQIAGPYCSKLLVDAGAEIVKVEPPEGDGLRASPLFAFLNAGKQSVIGGPDDEHVEALVAGADLVVEAHGLATDNGPALDVERVRREHPHLVVLSITPYGRTGPWAGRAATEFSLQAECGSLGIRGLAGQEPFQAGGRITEWAAGACGAAAALAAVLGAKDTGRGTHLDLSLLETANTVFANFSVTMNRLLQGTTGPPEHAFLAPAVETPSIEPTLDGYVGFCTNTRQQFADFLVMIDRADLVEDEQLAQFAGRTARFAEWNRIVHEWTTARTTAEIVELASLFRIPVTTVGNGKTVLEQEHLVERGVYLPSADGGYRQPRRPYLIDDEPAPSPGPVPDLDPARRLAFEPREPVPADDGRDLPLRGVKVLDLTGWWAGPAATHLFACMGAEVVHVESTVRPDGVRMVGGMMAAHYPDWWEASPHFMHVNANKRGVTIDLTDERGRGLLERLVGWCDLVFENFTPRVLDDMGIDRDWVRARNPRAIFVRMPGFGLSGPWRDRPGFAQTMEALSGMAWITGHRDDQPRIPRGPCDPIAGMHAAVAALVALARRRRTGDGHFVESTMAESALNIAAEQVLEWTARGRLLERDGNRSAAAAPQGLYPCRGAGGPTDGWLALSVASDEQWASLRTMLGDPGWAADPALATLAGRRERHDLVDEHLRAWTATQDRDELTARLRAAGIVASPVADPSRLVETCEQLAARAYFERPEHPVVGPMPLPGLPYRMEGVDRWLRTPAPTLGRDNASVLGGLGVDPDLLAQLADDDVVGTTPRNL